ncbi:hypothetical protein OIU79_017114 [Salix purpurea]|uniref:Uncharacterized protein n=1 Tax=Salix purpurea TaxID=77065 RepID=A0A9Q1AJJ0_SALPP|nr:hypothetical protein OIU79_017114 [Salix purpurea]
MKLLSCFSYLISSFKIVFFSPRLTVTLTDQRTHEILLVSGFRFVKILEIKIFLFTVVWVFSPTTNIGPCGRRTNGVAPPFYQ